MVNFERADLSKKIHFVQSPPATFAFVPGKRSVPPLPLYKENPINLLPPPSLPPSPSSPF